MFPAFILYLKRTTFRRPLFFVTLFFRHMLPFSESFSRLMRMRCFILSRICSFFVLTLNILKLTVFWKIKEKSSFSGLRVERGCFFCWRFWSKWSVTEAKLVEANHQNFGVAWLFSSFSPEVATILCVSVFYSFISQCELI